MKSVVSAVLIAIWWYWSISRLPTMHVCFSSCAKSTKNGSSGYSLQNLAHSSSHRTDTTGMCSCCASFTFAVRTVRHTSRSHPFRRSLA